MWLGPWETWQKQKWTLKHIGRRPPIHAYRRNLTETEVNLKTYWKKTTYSCVQEKWSFPNAGKMIRSDHQTLDSFVRAGLPTCPFIILFQCLPDPSLEYPFNIFPTKWRVFQIISQGGLTQSSQNEFYRVLNHALCPPPLGFSCLFSVFLSVCLFEIKE